MFVERSMGILDLGNVLASNITVEIPSLASTEAAYDPAGPPPTIRTVHSCGTDMLRQVNL